MSGIVDLRYVLSCESVGERDIILRTTQKTVTLSADSVPSREEWLKAICKVIFKAQNMGDTVKVSTTSGGVQPLTFVRLLYPTRSSLM